MPTLSQLYQQNSFSFMFTVSLTFVSCVLSAFLYRRHSPNVHFPPLPSCHLFIRVQSSSHSRHYFIWQLVLTLYSDRFAWRQAVQRSPFCPESRGCLSVPSISVSLTLFKEDNGKVILQLANQTSKKHFVRCTSKLSEPTGSDHTP
jgi:hypothetical protein